MAPLTTHARCATVTHGVAITFETLGEAPMPARLRPREATLLRVIDGIVRLTLEGEERLLGIGDEVVIPAGTRHRLSSAGGEASILTGFRPAER